MMSRDLLAFGIVDEVIPEPVGGAHRDHREAAASLKSYLIQTVRHLKEVPLDELLDRRYHKYRKIGVYFDPNGGAERNGQARS
jgi:acetyl-CoA carboxylase carboxyl transferase subunit alpha